MGKSAYESERASLVLTEPVSDSVFSRSRRSRLSINRDNSLICVVRLETDHDSKSAWEDVRIRYTMQ